MISSSVTERVVDIMISEKTRIATLSPVLGAKPTIIFCKKGYENQINNLVDKIGDSSLSVIVEPTDKIEEEKHIITDRVRYCNPGDKDYEYALAHAITYYKLSNGRTIWGVVKNRKS